MIRALSRLFAAAVLAAGLVPPAISQAALMADPQRLYAEMKAAYDKGTAHGWSYRDQEVYLSTIFNAGRAYSLQRPDDAGYGELNRLAVDIGSSLHYDPLVNHEAVPWYVREAAAWVIKNDATPAEVGKANALLARVDALEDPTRLAQFADEDAAANVQVYSRDPDARLQQIEADWRGWVITGDPSWRSLAFARANNLYFPSANLPTTWGTPFVDALKNAVHGAAGYTQGDKTNAQAVLERIQRVNPLMIIGNVRSISHDAYMTTLAPADEYFGPLGMSIIGINNELKRINLYLDSGWGDRESGAAVQVAVSIDDLHKVYPRDRDLPKLLLAVYKTLGRMHTSDTAGAAHHIRSILTVEYQDTAQAKELLET